MRYERGEANQYGSREYVAWLYSSEALARDTTSVEGLAQKKAVEAFQSAIEQERKDATRATPPGYGNIEPDPALSTLSQKRASEFAGRYALCIRLEPSGKLLAVSATFASIEEVNTAWQEADNPDLAVAICCRWQRRWLRLRFNLVLGGLQQG